MRLGCIGAIKLYRHRAASAIMQHHHGYKEAASEVTKLPMLVSIGAFIEPDQFELAEQMAADIEASGVPLLESKT